MGERIRPSRDEWAIQLMNVVALRSEDPTTRVGCVILDTLGRVVSTGYNGLPRGLSTNDFTLAERPIKYQHVVHADINAILFAERHRLMGSTMYLSFEPCCDCSKYIIQAGVSEVVYENHYKTKDVAGGQMIGLMMLLKSNIIVRQWRGPTHTLSRHGTCVNPYGEGVIINE